MVAGQEEPDGMAGQVAEALERLQEHSGNQLGDDEDPLLVSVRSGALGPGDRIGISANASPSTRPTSPGRTPLPP
jgi:hypothetical protein